MTKERFLTVRWNNLLALGLGIPLVAYAVVVLSTSVLSDLAGFIGMAVLAVIYWVVVEQHTAMRFAWLREKSGDDVPLKESLTSRIITVTYNVVWWLPLVLALTKAIDYRAGSIAFFAITVFRAFANLYRNNVLKGEQAEGFPLRAP